MESSRSAWEMSMFKLEGHTAIVTGGASGIGLATAQMLADVGANVVIADLNEAAGAQTAEELKARGAAALFVRTDVGEARDAEALIKAVTDRFGSLEILMHFAGSVWRYTPWKPPFRIGTASSPSTLREVS